MVRHDWSWANYFCHLDTFLCSALEPKISGQIMELHHSKHHATYVAGYNTAVSKFLEACSWSWFMDLANVMETEKIGIEEWTRFFSGHRHSACKLASWIINQGSLLLYCTFLCAAPYLMLRSTSYILTRRPKKPMMSTRWMKSKKHWTFMVEVFLCPKPLCPHLDYPWARYQYSLDTCIVAGLEDMEGMMYVCLSLAKGTYIIILSHCRT